MAQSTAKRDRDRLVRLIRKAQRTGQLVEVCGRLVSRDGNTTAWRKLADLEHMVGTAEFERGVSRGLSGRRG